MSRRPSDLVKTLRTHARDRAGDTAVIVLGPDGAVAQRITFGALDARALHVAASLRAHTPHGAPVLLPAPTTAATVAALVGCLYAGRPVAPAPLPGRNADLGHLTAAAAACRAQALMAPETFQPPAGALSELRWLSTDPQVDTAADPGAMGRRGPGGADVALLQFTSGSTRSPKAVRLTHDNLVADLEMLRLAFEVGRQSCFASWLPLFHDMGLTMLLMPLYFGVPGVLLPPLAFVRRPVRWLRMVQEHAATITGAPNFAFDLCLTRVSDDERAGLDLSGCDIVFCGAEPVRRSTMTGFARRFAPYGLRASSLYPCYGLAEAVCFVSGGRLFPDGLSDTIDDGPAPCGRAYGGLELKIVDPSTARPLPAGRVGEVWLKGANVGLGYVGGEPETPDTFGAVTADGAVGHLRTGDLGTLDAEGRLHLRGRIKDVLIHRGANILATDVELELADIHPGFAATGAAFSVPAGAGEGVVVVQEAARGVTGTSRGRMRAAGLEAVAARFGLLLHDLVVVRAGSLPKTTSGKVRRAAVRELYLAGGLVAAPPGDDQPASVKDQA